jgi:hypothetical protein
MAVPVSANTPTGSEFRAILVAQPSAGQDVTR